MTDNPTRREMLKRTATGLGAAGLLVSGVLNPSVLLAQAPSDKMKPEGWPSLSEEEKELLQIPLNEKEAFNLLKYKVNKVLDNKDVSNFLYSIGLFGKIIGPRTSKLAMNGIYVKKGFNENVVGEFKENNAWDTRKNEPITIGSVWRRFWERGSTRYHEEDIYAQIELLKGPAEKAKQEEKNKQNDVMYEKILGQNKSDMRGGIVPDTQMAQIKDKEELHEAVINMARRRPQLNFPKILNNIHAPTDTLRISRDDLEKIGIKVDERLKLLRSKKKAHNSTPEPGHTSGDEVASAGWVERFERGSERSAEL